jgi:16S rRNA processing protein RimM
MNVDDCFELGVIAKTHGLKGDVVLALDTKYPDFFTKLKLVYLLQNQALIPYFIKKISINGTQAIVSFDEIDHIDKASLLKNTPVYLPLTQLPPLDEDDYFLFQLVNMEVIDKNWGSIGIVHEIYNLPNNDLMAVFYQSAEVLIPVNANFILKVDKRKKIISVDLPEGYIEVYTSNNHKPDDGEI